MTATRILPVTGPGADFATRAAEEVAALAACASCPLSAVAGTNTLTATASYALDANRTGQRFSFVPANANTGAVTLDIDGKGALPVRDSAGAVLAAGRLVPGRLEEVINTGSEYRLLTAAPAVASGGARALFALQQANGTHGGTATTGSRQRYPLNTTVTNTIAGLSIDTVTNIGRLTVPAGTFRIDVQVGFYNVGRAGLYLRDQSGGGADITGLARAQFNDSGLARMTGIFTVASSRPVDLQYSCTSGQAANGLGLAASDPGGAVEQFGFLELTAVA